MRWLVVALVVAVLVGISAADVVATDWRTPTMTTQVCDLDEGGTGLCVQPRTGRSFLHDPTDEVWFVWVRDEEPIARFTSASWPFTSSPDVDIDITETGVTMTGSGIEVTYPADFYALD